MAKIITIASLKGGTGKTTLAVNLAMFLSALGKQALLIDLSPRGDATFCLGVKETPNFAGKVLENKIKAASAIKKTSYFGYDIIPSFPKLKDSTVPLPKARHAEKRLKNSLASIRKDYDFIIIDTAPCCDVLLYNALVASQSLIVPIQCEYLALRAAKELTDTVNTLTEKLNLQLELSAVLTMYAWRSRLSRNIAKQAKQEFPGHIFGTIIPKAAVLAQEEQQKEPILKSVPNCRAARAFRQLAEEIIENNRQLSQDSLYN